MDLKTFKSHELADRTAAARARIAEDDQVLSAQRERIAAFVGGFSLAGDVSGPSVDGGRSWSQRSAGITDILRLRNFLGAFDDGCSTAPPPPPPLPPPPPPPTQTQPHSKPRNRQPSNKEVEKNVIDDLSVLRQQAEELREATALELRPGQTVNPERIHMHRKAARTLYSAVEKKVSGARAKSHSILAMQDAINAELEKLKATLKTAASAPTPPKSAISVSTG